jgi:hypothetical protein
MTRLNHYRRERLAVAAGGGRALGLWLAGDSG